MSLTKTVVLSSVSLLLLSASTMAACTDTLGGAEDAGAPEIADAEVGDTSKPSPDAARLDAAIDANKPSEGGLADANADVLDGATNDGATSDGATNDATTNDASDASDGAVPLPPVTTKATVVGLADFDFTDTHLVTRATAGFSVCTLPACADGAAIAGVNNLDNNFSIAGTKLYFLGFGMTTTARDLYSINFDGTGRAQRSPATVWNGSTTVYSFLGDATNVSFLLRAVPLVGGGRYQTLGITANPAAPNAHRVPRPTAYAHSNVGATVAYRPPQNPSGSAVIAPTMVTTGATVPLPVTAPTAIAVSARGATVTYPAVVILRNGSLEACPTAADCAAWVDLGALGTIFTMDGEHLYVGGPTGLARCTLTEIATLGTCTLKAHVTGEAVSPPLLVTATDVWFRSGDDVRRVAK